MFSGGLHMIRLVGQIFGDSSIMCLSHHNIKLLNFVMFGLVVLGVSYYIRCAWKYCGMLGVLKIQGCSLRIAPE